ncbi:hypothetical protein ABEB36_001168 [Hypothenemus hampei]|uniref:CHK kinase-like domain-containing protein n=1 Tax=Hypothenemus hampei TaxID=57062 RepID=A0ABD1FDP9_HYPHA
MFVMNARQHEFVRAFVENQGFKGNPLIIEPACKKGDNYLGRIFAISINDVQHWIIKCVEDNQAIRAQLPLNEIFRREVILYEKVLPEFERFQRRVNLKYPFTSVAKYFGSILDEGDECLILDDVKNHNYIMLERKIAMDHQHVLIVIEEMAKFHSISLAMQMLERSAYEKLTEPLHDYFLKHEDIRNSFQPGFKKKLKYVIKIFNEHVQAKQCLIQCLAEIENILTEYENPHNHLVVVHGDVWYWQISRVQSPALDLLYFLFLSASKDVLDRYHNYQKFYYEKLRENVESVGCSLNSLFPYETFMDHCRKLSKIALFYAIGGLQVMVKKETEVRNFDDITKNGGKIVEQLFVDDYTSQEYNDRISNVIFMMINNGWL